MNRDTKVPQPTLERLATYLRYLNTIADKDDKKTISSADIERATGINAAQFRKDLSYFGEFGRPGIGYDVRELQKHIARILKVDEVQRVVMVGAGNLGLALLGYAALRRHNFHIVAVFDNNPNKIGWRRGDLEIQDIQRLREINESLCARIGILTVPAFAAQEVADKLVEAGVQVILNFAPINVRVPKGVVVRNVCFIQELTVLAYYLSADQNQQ